jgi:hypothetical protein
VRALLLPLPARQKVPVRAAISMGIAFVCLHAAFSDSDSAPPGVGEEDGGALLGNTAQMRQVQYPLGKCQHMHAARAAAQAARRA